MIRVTNDNLGRSLHNELYNRLRQACLSLNPEIPPEGVINDWLFRLYNNDPRLHILINLNDQMNGISEHAVIDVVNVYGTNIVYCHQIVKDKPTKDIVDEYMEYLDKLKDATAASCIAFTVAKNAKVYEKRYGYQTVRMMLVKFDALQSAQQKEA